jgi:hypothetical protein
VIDPFTDELASQCGMTELDVVSLWSQFMHEKGQRALWKAQVRPGLPGDCSEAVQARFVKWLDQTLDQR